MYLRAKNLLQQLAFVAGNQGLSDAMWSEVEDGLARILAEPWSWNFKSTVKSMPIVVIEPTSTWTYTAGNYFAVASAPLATLNYVHTGRRAYIGDRWYRAVDIGITNASRIYFDKPFVEDGTLDSMALIRDEFMVRASHLRTAKTDTYPKLARLSKSSLLQRFSVVDLDKISEGEPVCYLDSQAETVPAPAFPPSVVASATAGAFPVGTYYYFYTRVDVESGEESAPGPIFQYETASTNKPAVTYDNPDSPDECEVGMSYALRLYRSKRNPTRERCPMYALDTRPPDLPVVTPYLDEIYGNLVNTLPRWYNGHQIVLRLFPSPTSTPRSLEVVHTNDFGLGLEENDQVMLGLRGEVKELLEKWISFKVRGQNRDDQGKEVTQESFNRHMRYLMGKDREAGQTDLGPDNYVRIEPGYYPADDDGRWIDFLPDGLNHG